MICEVNIWLGGIGLRASHSAHVYDFYKPDLESEYPRVDGKLSIQCYLSALDKCYQGFSNKALVKNSERISLESFDAVVFHSPYCKLVQKSLARLLLNDVISFPNDELTKRYPELVGVKYGQNNYIYYANYHAYNIILKKTAFVCKPGTRS